MADFPPIDLSKLHSRKEIDSALSIYKQKDIWPCIDNKSIFKLDDCPETISSSLEEREGFALSEEQYIFINACFFIFKRTKEVFYLEPEKQVAKDTFVRHRDAIDKAIKKLSRLLKDERFTIYNDFVTYESGSDHHQNHQLSGNKENLLLFIERVNERNQTALDGIDPRGDFLADNSIYSNHFEIEKILSENSKIQLTSSKDSPYYYRFFLVRMENLLKVSFGKDNLSTEDFSLIESLFLLYQRFHDIPEVSNFAPGESAESYLVNRSKPRRK